MASAQLHLKAFVTTTLVAFTFLLITEGCQQKQNTPKPTQAQTPLNPSVPPQPHFPLPGANPITPTVSSQDVSGSIFVTGVWRVSQTYPSCFVSDPNRRWVCAQGQGFWDAQMTVTSNSCIPAGQYRLIPTSPSQFYWGTFYHGTYLIQTLNGQSIGVLNLVSGLLYESAGQLRASAQLTLSSTIHFQAPVVTGIGTNCWLVLY